MSSKHKAPNPQMPSEFRPARIGRLRGLIEAARRQARRAASEIERLWLAKQKVVRGNDVL